MTIPFDTVVPLPTMALKSWEALRMSAIASAEARDGNTNTSTATLKIESLVEVRDLGGNIVPILKVCTASGTTY